MNPLLPLIAAILQAGSFTLDKFILSMRSVSYKTYNGVSFPLSVLILAVLFLIIQPPLLPSVLTGGIAWLIAISIIIGIGGNILFYRALDDDSLSEMQTIELLQSFPILFLSGVVFLDERNLYVIIPALTASVALFWSHWESKKFNLAPRPHFNINSGRDACPFRAGTRSDDAGVVGTTSRRSDTVSGAEWPHPLGFWRFSFIASLLRVAIEKTIASLSRLALKENRLRTRLGINIEMRSATWPFFVWSLTAIPAGALISKTLLAVWNPVSLELVRWSAIALVTSILFYKEALAIQRRAFYFLVLTNILSTIGWVLFYYSYQRSGIIYTLLLFSLQPFLVYLAAFLLFKEKIHWKKSVAFLVVLASIIAAQVL